MRTRTQNDPLEGSLTKLSSYFLTTVRKPFAHWNRFIAYIHVLINEGGYYVVGNRRVHKIYGINSKLLIGISVRWWGDSKIILWGDFYSETSLKLENLWQTRSRESCFIVRCCSRYFVTLRRFYDLFFISLFILRTYRVDFWSPGTWTSRGFRWVFIFVCFGSLILTPVSSLSSRNM